MAIITQAEANEILNDRKCVCGNHKGDRTAFCHKDYFELPYQLRQSLYSRVGQGFEEAYSAARDIVEMKIAKRSHL